MSDCDEGIEREYLECHVCHEVRAQYSCDPCPHCRRVGDAFRALGRAIAVFCHRARVDALESRVADEIMTPERDQTVESNNEAFAALAHLRELALKGAV